MVQRTLLHFVTMVLLALCTSLTISCQPFLLEVKATPAPPRQVSSNNLGWQETWRRPLRLEQSEAPSAVVVNDLIIMVVEGQNGLELTALNIQTGQTAWTREFSSPYGTLDAIAADNDQVYVAESFVVKAFRAMDGKPVWTTQELLTHTEHDLFFGNQSGLIHDQARTADSKFMSYAIDIHSGAIRNAMIGPLMAKLSVGNTTYSVDRDYNLVRVDAPAENARWIAKTQGVQGQPAMINAQTLVFQDGPFFTSLNGLDPALGKALWRTPQRNIVSNFIAIGNTLYAITPDPAIVAYDALTGHETGRIGFSGSGFVLGDGPAYWLLATKNKIFAYLSDSQELIAFSRK